MALECAACCLDLEVNDSEDAAELEGSVAVRIRAGLEAVAVVRRRRGLVLRERALQTCGVA